MDISCIILAKNEEDVIEVCLQSLKLLKPAEILLINDDSTDKTLGIAKKHGVKILNYTLKGFDQSRNFAAEKSKGKWLLYIDADESLSPDLAKEINQIIESNGKTAAYEINRVNYYLGKRWPKKDKLIRLMQKKALVKWYGSVHETPQINGEIGKLKGELIHQTHRNLNEMIINTLKWSKIEAKLRYEQNHPKVVWWRLPRVMVPTFFDYYIKQGGWKTGTIGLIESIYQAFSIFITYAQLWELQQKKSQ